MATSSTIAVDLAKSVFEVAVSTQPGRVATRHRLTRPQFARFVATPPPATVLMEACGTAHFWGRRAQAHGHRVVLLPPPPVRPYVLRNKTDRADATGLLDAARNDSIHPVPLRTIPVVGLLTATALVAFVGDAHRFPTARHFASYLGLTPREHSSGLRRRLGAITKRGDPYLRMLLIHGARSVLGHANRAAPPRPLQHWALTVAERRGPHPAAGALANKLARIVWAVVDHRHRLRTSSPAAGPPHDGAGVSLPPDCSK
jgi:transposase